MSGKRKTIHVEKEDNLGEKDVCNSNDVAEIDRKINEIKQKRATLKKTITELEERKEQILTTDDQIRFARSLTEVINKKVTNEMTSYLFDFSPLIKQIKSLRYMNGREPITPIQAGLDKTLSPLFNTFIVSEWQPFTRPELIHAWSQSRKSTFMFLDVYAHYWFSDIPRVTVPDALRVTEPETSKQLGSGIVYDGTYWVPPKSIPFQQRGYVSVPAMLLIK